MKTDLQTTYFFILFTLFIANSLFAAEMREGIQKTVYPGGQLKEEMNYKASQLDGVYKSYYENGALKSESAYAKGRVGVNLVYIPSVARIHGAYAMQLKLRAF